MSYVKNTWATGDTVTAAKLNNMESGIEAATSVFLVTLTGSGEEWSADATYAEIKAAYDAGQRIWAKCSNTLSEMLYLDVGGTYMFTSSAVYVAGSRVTQYDILIGEYQGQEIVQVEETIFNS